MLVQFILPVTYAHLVYARVRIILRNSFHQEVYLAATLYYEIRFTQASHPTTQAFRLHCRVASDCPRPSLPCNA